MSHRIGNVTIICPTDPEKCQLCGETAECRPYGPKGERICFDCGQKDPQTTERQMNRVLFGDTVQ